MKPGGADPQTCCSEHDWLACFGRGADVRARFALGAERAAQPFRAKVSQKMIRASAALSSGGDARVSQ